jgi:hypothetical protein
MGPVDSGRASKAGSGTPKSFMRAQFPWSHEDSRPPLPQWGRELCARAGIIPFLGPAGVSPAFRKVAAKQLGMLVQSRTALIRDPLG